MPTVSPTTLALRIISLRKAVKRERERYRQSFAN